ncbi:hypothetical protein Clacol_002510 [Clathrus columnatus]|uniref:Sugar phosphate phosphatase n=1 Tax=Clathrus columnatus TaxID=1419009 RepID=A0AAV5A4Z8_9AGAM|nr:hypothetical protein Clacol_002510 [Clathrus columnatus]
MNPSQIEVTGDDTSGRGSEPDQRRLSTVTLQLDHLPARKDIQPSYPRPPTKVDPNNPPWPAYRGYHEYSFAHATMGVRLPTILGKAINDAVETLNTLSEEDRIIDLSECIHRMGELMTDLSTNRKLRPIIDDGEGDIALWNKEIAKYFRGKDFMNAPWLFAEAYKYRRLHECFSISKHWKACRYKKLTSSQHYDVFRRQKCDTFARSGDAVFELSLRFAEPSISPTTTPNDQKLERDRLLFMELAQGLSSNHIYAYNFNPNSS